MNPRIIDSMTHRELNILLRSNTEYIFDNYEKQAYGAMMNRQAYHAKRLKLSDLFTRPLDVEEAKNRQKDLLQKREDTMEWLSQYDFNA